MGYCYCCVGEKLRDVGWKWLMVSSHIHKKCHVKALRARKSSRVTQHRNTLPVKAAVASLNVTGSFPSKHPSLESIAAMCALVKLKHCDCLRPCDRGGTDLDDVYESERNIVHTAIDYSTLSVAPLSLLTSSIHSAHAYVPLYLVHIPHIPSRSEAMPSHA